MKRRGKPYRHLIYGRGSTSHHKREDLHMDVLDDLLHKRISLRALPLFTLSRHFSSPALH